MFYVMGEPQRWRPGLPLVHASSWSAATRDSRCTPGEAAVLRASRLGAADGPLHSLIGLALGLEHLLTGRSGALMSRLGTAPGLGISSCAPGLKCTSLFWWRVDVLQLWAIPTTLPLPIEGTGPYLWTVILHQLQNRTHSLAQGPHAYSLNWSCSVSSLCEESILLSCACENVSLGDPDICQTQRALTFWGCCSQCGQQVTLAG